MVASVSRLILAKLSLNTACLFGDTLRCSLKHDGRTNTSSGAMEFFDLDRGPGSKQLRDNLL